MAQIWIENWSTKLLITDNSIDTLLIELASEFDILQFALRGDDFGRWEESKRLWHNQLRCIWLQAFAVYIQLHALHARFNSLVSTLTSNNSISKCYLGNRNACVVLSVFDTRWLYCHRCIMPNKKRLISSVAPTVVRSRLPRNYTAFHPRDEYPS